MDRLHTERVQLEERAASLGSFREHALRSGVNPILYWTLRAILVPFFLLYFRLQRTGREHLPRTGPLLLASNHRSFLDPFVIGTLVRRPVYYMAKRELFEKRWQALLLNALGAFPVDRGAGDRDAIVPPAQSSSAETAWSCSPRAPARGPARWARRGVASGGWRLKRARRWRPSR
jgi:1-acyl-sn-glycerol-3-phosphate acyltransferase